MDITGAGPIAVGVGLGDVTGALLTGAGPMDTGLTGAGAIGALLMGAGPMDTITGLGAAGVASITLGLGFGAARPTPIIAKLESSISSGHGFNV